MKELFDDGVFKAFYDFSDWELSLAVYVCTFIGFAIQAVIAEKSKNTLSKWIYLIFLVTGVTVCEILTQVINGWNQILVGLIYGIVICNIIGALIAAILHFARNQ